MKAVQLIIFSMILLLSGALNAAETRFLLQLGIEGGGEDLLETTEDDISAGGGWLVGGGFSYEPENSSIAYVGTVSYMFDSVSFDIPSGDSSFNTIPLEFSVRKKFGGHHVGGGLSYHLSPEWELCVDGIGCDNLEFDSSLGFNILYSYNTKHSFVTLKYTIMEYEIFGVSVDADSFGAIVGYKF